MLWEGLDRIIFLPSTTPLCITLALVVEEGFSKGPCSRRVLICLCVCVSVVSLASAEEVPAHENDGANVVVHITDEGFEPQTLEVQSGETVVFENSGQNPHWPASDEHPTHTK